MADAADVDHSTMGANAPIGLPSRRPSSVWKSGRGHLLSGRTTVPKGRRRGVGELTTLPRGLHTANPASHAQTQERGRHRRVSTFILSSLLSITTFGAKLGHHTHNRMLLPKILVRLATEEVNTRKQGETREIKYN